MLFVPARNATEMGVVDYFHHPVVRDLGYAALRAVKMMKTAIPDFLILLQSWSASRKPAKF
jgi:hypothetical protein